MTKDELRDIIREVMSEKAISDQKPVHELITDEKFTSIKQIADFFVCSLPTAQKIKNKIPKDQYAQFGKRFSIPLTVLIDYGKRKS